MISGGDRDLDGTGLFADKRSGEGHAGIGGLAGECSGKDSGASAEGAEFLARGFAEGFGDGSAGDIDAGEAVLVDDLEVDVEDMAFGGNGVDAHLQPFPVEDGDPIEGGSSYHPLTADEDIPCKLQPQLAAAREDGLFGDESFDSRGVEGDKYMGGVHGAEGVGFVGKSQDGERGMGWRRLEMSGTGFVSGVGLRMLEKE